MPGTRGRQAISKSNSKDSDVKSPNRPQVKKAIVWSFLQRISQQGLKFGIGIALARLLEPEDFGLLAMVTVLTAVSDKVIGLGLSSALIQKDDADDIDCSTVFLTNLSFALLIYALLFAAAPQVASFYREEALTTILRVLALTIIARAGYAIHTTLLTKRLDFKTPLRIGNTAVLVAGGISILMALQGYQVWALVAQPLTTALLSCLLYWLHGSWQPTWTFSFPRLRSLATFGFKITLINVIEVTFNHLHAIVIGRVFTPVDLGFFARAKSLQQFATINIMAPLSQVVYPALARIKSDPQQLAKTYHRSLGLTAFLIFPVMTGLALTADSVVFALLGNKWMETAPLLQILCLIGALVPIRNQCSNALKAIGQLNTIIKIQVFGRLFSLLGIIITYSVGVEAMIWGETVAMTLLILAFLTAVSRHLTLSLSGQLSSLVPYALSSMIMAVVILALPLETVLSHWTRLLITLPIGAIVYTLACGLVRAPAFIETAQIAYRYIQRRNGTPA